MEWWDTVECKSKIIFQARFLVLGYITSIILPKVCGHHLFMYFSVLFLMFFASKFQLNKMFRLQHTTIVKKIVWERPFPVPTVSGLIN